MPDDEWAGLGRCEARPATGYRITVAGSGRVLAARARVARTKLERMVGLLSRACLGDGEGLVIPECWSIHTCFMRFTIDVVFVDHEGTVLKVRQGIGPWRLASGGWGTASVVEVAQGAVKRAGVGVGDRLRLSRLVAPEA